MRLNEFLNTDPDQVILSICKDSKAWEEFLKSDIVNPSKNPDNNLLHLVMQILADKVVNETILQNQQIEVCLPTTSEDFRQCLIHQCGNITMSIEPRSRFPNRAGGRCA